MRFPLSMTLLVLIPGLAAAAVLDVFPDGSGTYTDLHHALLAAGSGDTIRLADGVFSGAQNRNLLIGGPDLTILSAGGDPGSCSLDLQGQGRAFLVFSTPGSRLSIEGLTIRNGDPTGLPEEQWPGYGGAVMVEGIGPGGEVRLAGCILSDNFAAAGGAVFLLENEAAFEHCLFRDNRATDGAGVYCGYCEAGSGPTFSFCLFSGNDFPHPEVGGYGAGIYFSHSRGEVGHCTFVGNRAWFGAGLLVSTDSLVQVSRCLIAFNLMGEGTGVHSGTVQIDRTDIFGNEGGDWVGPIADQVGIECNIALDPIFCDLDQEYYYLDPASPCLPENNDCEALMGTYGVGCGPSALPDDGLAIPALRLTGNHPNPFNPSTTIVFEIVRAAPVHLDLFDVGGRLVRSLRRGRMESAGPHETRWDGRDDQGRAVPSGSYFCRLKSAGETVTMRMTLLR